MARNLVIKSWPLLCHVQATRGFSLISQSVYTSSSTKFGAYSDIYLRWTRNRPISKILLEKPKAKR